ncbi:MAG TPA: class I SAM-dependent methyltransferase, partial [Elusimicrobiota bacterium]|nr:class I SAM-dependent methyltransferase [Elusimicrobiota bacterium]
DLLNGIEIDPGFYIAYTNSLWKDVATAVAAVRLPSMAMAKTAISLIAALLPQSIGYLTRLNIPPNSRFGPTQHDMGGEAVRIPRAVQDGWLAAERNDHPAIPPQVQALLDKFGGWVTKISIVEDDNVKNFGGGSYVWENHDPSSGHLIIVLRPSTNSSSRQSVGRDPSQTRSHQSGASLMGPGLNPAGETDIVAFFHEVAEAVAERDIRAKGQVTDENEIRHQAHVIAAARQLLEYPEWNDQQLEDMAENDPARLQRIIDETPDMRSETHHAILTGHLTAEEIKEVQTRERALHEQARRLQARFNPSSSGDNLTQEALANPPSTPNPNEIESAPASPATQTSVAPGASTISIDPAKLRALAASFAGSPAVADAVRELHSLPRDAIDRDRLRELVHNLDAAIHGWLKSSAGQSGTPEGDALKLAIMDFFPVAIESLTHYASQDSPDPELRRVALEGLDDLPAGLEALKDLPPNIPFDDDYHTFDLRALLAPRAPMRPNEADVPLDLRPASKRPAGSTGSPDVGRIGALAADRLLVANLGGNRALYGAALDYKTINGAGRTAADIGAGGKPAPAEAFVEAGFRTVYLIDYAPGFGAEASPGVLEPVRADATQLPLKANSLDVAVFNQSLSHIADQASALRNDESGSTGAGQAAVGRALAEARRILKDDGWLFIKPGFGRSERRAEETKNLLDHLQSLHFADVDVVYHPDDPSIPVFIFARKPAPETGANQSPPTAVTDGPSESAGSGQTAVLPTSGRDVLPNSRSAIVRRTLNTIRDVLGSPHPPVGRYATDEPFIWRFFEWLARPVITLPLLGVFAAAYTSSGLPWNPLLIGFIALLSLIIVFVRFIPRDGYERLLRNAVQSIESGHDLSDDDVPYFETLIHIVWGLEPADRAAKIESTKAPWDEVGVMLVHLAKHDAFPNVREAAIRKLMAYIAPERHTQLADLTEYIENNEVIPAVREVGLNLRLRLQTSRDTDNSRKPAPETPERTSPPAVAPQPTPAGPSGADQITRRQFPYRGVTAMILALLGFFGLNALLRWMQRSDLKKLRSALEPLQNMTPSDSDLSKKLSTARAEVSAALSFSSLPEDLRSSLELLLNLLPQGEVSVTRDEISLIQSQTGKTIRQIDDRLNFRRPGRRPRLSPPTDSGHETTAGTDDLGPGAPLTAAALGGNWLQKLAASIRQDGVPLREILIPTAMGSVMEARTADDREKAIGLGKALIRISDQDPSLRRQFVKKLRQLYAELEAPAASSNLDDGDRSFAKGQRGIIKEILDYADLIPAPVPGSSPESIQTPHTIESGSVTGTKSGSVAPAPPQPTAPPAPARHVDLAEPGMGQVTGVRQGPVGLPENPDERTLRGERSRTSPSPAEKSSEWRTIPPADRELLRGKTREFLRNILESGSGGENAYDRELPYLRGLPEAYRAANKLDIKPEIFTALLRDLLDEFAVTPRRAAKALRDGRGAIVKL